MTTTNEDLRRRAEEIVLNEFGYAMFNCDDEEDGCPEIISDKIKAIEKALADVHASADREGWERGRKELGKFYEHDGTVIYLTPEECVKQRKEAAIKLHALEIENQRLNEVIANSGLPITLLPAKTIEK